MKVEVIIPAYKPDDKLIKATRDKGLAAGDAACQRNTLHLPIVCR